MNIHFISLGCTKNQVDSEIMQGMLEAAGYQLVQSAARADIIVVNTCGFIEPAKAESIDAILTAARHKRGRCRALVVAGCLSQRYAEDLMGEIPEIDGMVGTNTFHKVKAVIEEALAGRRTAVIGEEHYDYSHALNRRLSNSHSAYLKVAEGCSNMCSYCAIPLIRGEFRSRPLPDLVAETERLARQGVREINLVAQDTTRYGLDLYGKFSLAELLRRLLKVPGPDWFRLLYCYPAHLTDEVLHLMAANNRVLKYIDLPLQHISPAMLKGMGRKVNARQTEELIARIRAIVPGVVIRTTFIVGFPGENEEDFSQLYDFVSRMRFDHVGVFTYSREEGTPSHDMADQVSQEVSRRRQSELMELQVGISRDNNSRYVGKRLPVLIETVKAGGRSATGRAEKDAPDVDGRVYVRGRGLRPGDLVSVMIESSDDYDLWGVTADDPGQ